MIMFRMSSPELGERHIEVKSLMNIVREIAYFKSIHVEKRES